MSETRYPTRRNWWPFSVVFVVLILAGAFFLYHYSPLRVAGSATDRIVGGARELLREFTRDDIALAFESKLLALRDTNGGRLVVAELQTAETFRREVTSAFRGTTVSEVSTDAIFKYEVPLQGGWQIDIEESGEVRACRVIAPCLQPSLPVAFKSDGLRTRSSEGWLRWDETEEMEALMSQMTPELEKRAFAHLDSARETARKTIKDFVRTWLLENDQWNDDRFGFVEVQFADEVSAADGPEGGDASLR